MCRIGRIASISLLFLCPPSAPARAQAADSAAMERARVLTHWFYDGELARVTDAFNPEILAAIGGADALSSFRTRALADVGEEVRVMDEEVTRSGRQIIYRRTARFSSAPAPVVVLWGLDEAGRVTAFRMAPDQGELEPAPSEHLDYRTRTALRLPFLGEWTVYWGGRTVEENYHVASVNQRFAYDFVVTVDGRRHDGEGTANEDYHCFGRPVVAPAPGVVTAVEQEVADNQPGVLDTSRPPGNHVVLDHGNGEHSILAHLRQGSVIPDVGEEVATGDTIGQCGNSGNSSEPHLHYHLQDAPDPASGEGLPAQFRNYTADGERVERGEPVRGQRIRPAGLRPPPPPR